MIEFQDRGILLELFDNHLAIICLYLICYQIVYLIHYSIYYLVKIVEFPDILFELFDHHLTVIRLLFGPLSFDYYLIYQSAII